MSQSRIDATLVILAVSGIMAIAGCIVGSIFALVFWDAAASQRLLGGLIVGAVMGLGIGFIMAWHGISISRSPGRAQRAAAWGIIPAGLLGLSLAPPIGAAVGLAFGQFVMAGLLGLVAGPLLAVVAWELAYWADELLIRSAPAR